MTEIDLDTEELERLIKKIEESPEILKEAKRTAFEDAAPKLKQILDARIESTIGDSHGKIRSWQDYHVGSKGGYAAVRPKAETFTEVNGRGKRYAVGYVTNAINSGHRFPRPSGKAKKSTGRGSRASSRTCRGDISMKMRKKRFWSWPRRRRSGWWATSRGIWRDKQ